MNDPAFRLAAHVRTMQIIATALLMGVVFFLGIALYLVQTQGAIASPDFPVVSLVALFVLISNVTLALFLPGFFVQGGLRRLAGNRSAEPGSDRSALLLVRQSSMIVTMALIEGAAFLGCIAYLLEGSPVALAVAGLSILILLGNFPTEGRVQTWLEQNSQRLNTLRHEAGPRTGVRS